MHIPFVKEIAIFLLITGVVIPVMARLRINPVLGFLALGLAIGPYGFASIQDMPTFFTAFAFHDIDAVRAIGEIGVVLLLFLIGIELAPARLWAMRRLIFGLGTAQIFVCAAVIGAIAWLWGNSAGSSAVLGLSLALSSTAMVMKIIMDRGHFASPAGQAGFSILLLQDLAVVPIIFLITILQQDIPRDAAALALALELAQATGVVILIVVTGLLVVRPALRFVAAGRGGPEYFMAFTLLILLAAASATHYAGLSMALGAFLAGLVFADTEFRNQIEIDMEPFKGLFMGLFFMSVGMAIDLRLVMNNLFWLFGSVIGLFTIKAILIAALARTFSLSWPVAARTGITLGQAGEFAFVLIGMAFLGGIIPENVAQFMILVASLTLVLTPAAYRLGEWCEDFSYRLTGTSREDSLTGIALELSDHVVIAGFGRTGQAVARTLEDNQIPYLALDTDSTNLDMLRSIGKPVFFGDASNLQALNKVRAHKARTVVIALDDKKAAQRVIENIRHQCPQALIYARARDEDHARELKKRGVTATVLETEGVSQSLANRVLEDAR